MVLKVFILMRQVLCLPLTPYHLLNDDLKFNFITEPEKRQFVRLEKRATIKFLTLTL